VHGHVGFDFGVHKNLLSSADIGDIFYIVSGTRGCIPENKITASVG
jgi:hypothetical protein